MRQRAHRRRHIAQVNLALCFPHWSDDQRQRVLEQHFESLGMAAVETALCWWAPERKLRALIREIEGEHHLEQALERGRGALLLSAHFTHLEIGSTLLALHRPIGAVYRPHQDPIFGHAMRRSRERHGAAIPREDTRAMLRLLRRNQPLWYAPDQNYNGPHRVFAPFFGVPAATNAATSGLAKISRAPVIPFYQERLPEGAGYRLVFLPALNDFPSDDVLADATRINRALEELVQRQVADYLWVHRRFKTRPEGAADVYSR